MKTFSLAPYNFWVLYAAIGVLLIFCIVEAVRLNRLLKVIRRRKPTYSHIETGIKLSKVKVDAIKTKAVRSDTGRQSALSALLLLLAILKEYRKSDRKGLSEFNRVAMNTFDKQKRKSQALSQLTRSFQH